MNATLLARFAGELRAAIRWHYLDEPRWFTPVLSLPFDRGRNHLVVVLEAPGPFCFLHGESPFAGADAPPRLAPLKGARIEDVSVEHRVLRIDVLTKHDEERLTLRIELFGANGSAILSRDDTVMEVVGRRKHRRESGDPATPKPANERSRELEVAMGPFALVVAGRVASASPRAPDMASSSEGVLDVFDNALSACAHAGSLVLNEAQALMLHRIARPARRKLDSLRRLSQNLEVDLARAAEHGDERREAETLAAYQTRVHTGAASIELPDLYDPDRLVRIALDPKLPIHVQVEKRFRRATKLEKGLAHLTRRRELVTRELSELEAAFALLGRITSFGEALKLYEVMRAKFGISLERTAAERSASPRKAAREKTYRTFELDANWYAMVGRNNHENDEITFRVSAPGDWWFHAEGVAGSHVVLRPQGGVGKDGPPARILEQAASIAAHFSKARHSALVPVIYTRRRYVRKFRGAAPGQVKCERESMVMVPPLLPGNDE